MNNLFSLRRLLLPLLLLGTLAARAQNVGIGTTSPTQTLDVNGSLRLRGLTGSGNRLPVVQPDGTLGTNAPVYSTPTTATAVQAASVGTGTYPYGLAVSGTTAYVVNYNSNTLQTFNVSNPANPTLLGSVGTGTYPYGLAVSGTTAYVVNYNSNTLQAFNVSNPASPTLLGSVGTGSNPDGVAVSGTTAYVTNYGSNTLQAFNVSNPASPTLLASVATGSYPYGLAVSGTTAYVTNVGSNSLLVTNVPLQPRAMTVNPDGSLGSVAFPASVIGPTGATGPQGPAGLNGTNSLVAGPGLSAATTSNTTTVALGGAALTAATDVPLAGNSLTFSGSGNVGIGTGSPGQRLEVAGTIFSSSGGFKFPDGSTQTVAASGTGFIQNTTTQQASSNFNVSGSGTIGGNSTVGGNQTVAGTSTLTGLLSATGGATVTGATSLNASGTAATNIGTSSTAGPVSLGRTGGTVALAGNVAVANNLRRAVRLCPATNGAAYTLVAADLAFDNIKVATGNVPTTLTLPTSSAGQTTGQELTIYNTASSGFTISGTNTDNTLAVTVQSATVAGAHAVKYLWDGIWIRVQ